MIRVRISTAVYPTEDLEKVIKAISSLFPDIAIKKTPEEDSIGTTNTKIEVPPSFTLSEEGGIELLSTLHGLIRREEIIDSIRDKAFSKGLSNDWLSVNFLLNKQAAFVGVPSIPAEEESLGSIEVVITADSKKEMERLFEWLLPPTEEGKPIVEVEMEYVERD